MTLTLLGRNTGRHIPTAMVTPGSAKVDAPSRRANPPPPRAGAVMQTDYAGQTVEVIDPQTGEVRQAQIFVAVLGASSLTFAMRASVSNCPIGSKAKPGPWRTLAGFPKRSSATI